MLIQGLEDDDWRWDWTTLGTMPSSTQRLKAQVIAKSDGIWAGHLLVDALNQFAQEQEGLGESSTPHLRVRSRLKDGDRFKPGTVLTEWSGSGRLLLALERPFLNLASFVCGIATRTEQLVGLVQRACPRKTPRVTSTRKILPGYRDLCIHGVLAGGGFSHRMSLSGGVLIKENHIAAAGGMRRAVEGVRRIAPHGLKIEIEVRTAQELREALKVEADIVMLDNFTPQQIKAALPVVDQARRRPILEVSGGLNEKNISTFAMEGVDVLSVGSLTHSVKAVDLSLLVNS